jgi:hypothetical protein
VTRQNFFQEPFFLLSAFTAFYIVVKEPMASPSSVASGGASEAVQGTSKYGKQSGEGTIALFKGTGKSGLTPIEAVDPNRAATTQSQQQATEHEDHQRRHLRSFTSRELQDADSLEIAELPMGNMNFVTIHEALRQSRWLESEFKIDGGFECVWGGKNDKVLDILGPCLRLTTRLLSNAQVGLW